MAGLTLRGLNSGFSGIYQDTTKNSVLSHTELDYNFIYLKGHIIYDVQESFDTITFKKLNGENLSFTIPTDIHVTGGTYSNGTTIFTNNTGGTFNVAGYYTGATDVYTTGATYNSSNGIATFTNNTGGTFNLNGLFKVSDDVYVTGMTFNNSNYNLTLSRNDGNTFTQNLGILSSDMVITGGTYSPSNGVATFTNNSGGTFNVTGFLTGMTDTYVTGGTYNSSNGITTFTNNSGSTFNVSGFTTGSTEVFVTGATYNSNTFTYRNNTGGTFNVSFNSVTGLTVDGILSATTISGDTIYANDFPQLPYTDNETVEVFTSGGTGYLRVKDIVSAPSGGTRTFVGNVNVTSGLSASTISATTYYNLPTDIRVTGGTYSNSTGISTFTNNTGGTFSVSGFSTGTTLPIIVVNTTSLVSTGLTGSGFGAPLIDNSIFLGVNAGYQSTGTTYSNFFGSSSGYQATGVTNSNFIGKEAGISANDSDNSNFIGNSAGRSANNSTNSNFIGLNAGSGASSATGSNFIGNSAGYDATGVTSANFIGASAGRNANDSDDSNFIGREAGFTAFAVTFSNFFGYRAGYQAISSSSSNFIGNNAGYQASGATGSNFFGYNTGYLASDSDDSNFIGPNAGYQASSSSSSNFIGNGAGYQATGATYSNFFGYQAGYDADSSGYSNFIGVYAGSGAKSSVNSNFMGVEAGRNATGVTYSNFFGRKTGEGANDSTYSNFFGDYAGYGAKNSEHSNFIGEQSGYYATGGTYSNFIGYQAGYSSKYITNSNFIGQGTGNGATGATFSNLFGYRTGYSFTNNQLGSNNIIIGTNISLPNATANAINIGGVLFGTGTYSATGASSPSITAISGGKIGIGVVTPLETLHVNGSIVLSKDSSYTSLSDGATTPVPNGSGGTMVYDSVTTSFYGWIGTSWSKLNGDSYTTGFTYSANTFTIKRNNGLSDLTASINSMTGLTVSGTISATTISGNTIYANDFPQLPYVDNQTIDSYTSGSDSYIRLKDIVAAPSGGTRTFYGNTVLSNSGTTYTSNLGINTNSPAYTIDAYGSANSRLLYSSSSGGILNISGSTGIPRFGASAGPDGGGKVAGITFGARSWDDIAFPSYGKQGDAFTYSSAESNGLNFLSVVGTGTEDYIRFYAGQTASTGNTADIHIQGTGATRGYVGLATHTPTERLDVAGAIKIGNNSYTSLSDGATTPVPNGGAGTMVFDSGTSSFYGWTGSVWKKLHT